MKQDVRIIGGKYRGKKLGFPDIEGLRPTPSRVRETLFNWLMHRVQDARCLDAFAGSGALGIEAFSRGAKEVIFVEQSSLAFAELKKNLLHFQNPSLTALKMDAGEFLTKVLAPFDLIFLDPPFANGLLPNCLSLIAQNKLLTAEGLLYVESGEELIIDPLVWQVLRSKKAGFVYYALLKRLSLD